MRLGLSPLEWGIIEGENPVMTLCLHVLLAMHAFKSQVVWECSLKWVVSFI